MPSRTIAMICGLVLGAALIGCTDGSSGGRGGGGGGGGGRGGGNGSGGGGSAEGFRAVTVFPAVESEPNEDDGSAGQLSDSSSGSGTLAAGDVDVWAFEAAAGSVVQIELHSTRLAQAVWTRPLLIEVAGPDGTALVRNWAALFPDLAGDLDIQAMPIAETGTHYLRLSTDNLEEGPYAITVRTLDYPNLAREDGDTTPSQPQALMPGVSTGELSPTDDADAYELVIDEPTIVALEVLHRRVGIAAETTDFETCNLRLLDAAGTELARSSDMFFGDGAIRYLLTSPGTYTVELLSNDPPLGVRPYFLVFEATAAGNLQETEGSSIAFGAIVHGTNDGPVEGFSFEGTAGDLVRIYTHDSGNHQAADVSAPPLVYQLVDPSTGAILPIDFDSGHALRVLRAWLPADGFYELQISGGSTAGTPYAVQLERFNGTRVASGINQHTFNDRGFASGQLTDGHTFAVPAEAGELVTVLAHVRGDTPVDGWGSDLDPDLAVTLDGTPIAGSETASLTFSRSLIHLESRMHIAFIAEAAATYLVSITGIAGPQAHYALQHLRDLPPRLALPPASSTASHPPADPQAFPLHLDACPTGHAIIGFEGALVADGTERHGSVAPVCAALRVSALPIAGPVELGAPRVLLARGSGDAAWSRTCPAEHVVVGFAGRASDTLDELRLRCAPLVAARADGRWTFTTGDVVDLEAIGSAAGDDFEATDCDDGDVAILARLGALPGQPLRSFGLRCGRPHIRVLSDVNEP